jgi:hypothetical protein
MIKVRCMNDRNRTWDRTACIFGSEEVFRNSHNIANNDVEKHHNPNPEPSRPLAACSSRLPSSSVLLFVRDSVLTKPNEAVLCQQLSLPQSC